MDGTGAAELVIDFLLQGKNILKKTINYEPQK